MRPPGITCFPGMPDPLTGRVRTGLVQIILVPIILVLAGLVLVPPANAAQANTRVDNGIYATLLGQHVKKNRVDYEGFKRDEALLDSYLAILSSIDAN